MKVININVKLKEKGTIDLVLYKKLYSTPNGIVEHWSTDLESQIRLHVIIDEEDLVVDALKVSKDLNILTSEAEIADIISAKILNARVKYSQAIS